MGYPEWNTVPDEEKARIIRHRVGMAGFMRKDVRFTERERSIIECTAEDVTSKELRALFLRMKRSRCSLQEIGAIRIHYDHLIDDAEKVVRQYLGLEKDYSHKVTECAIYADRKPFASIDGIPMNAWCLLYLPEKATKTRGEINRAIEWCMNNNRYEAAEMLQQRYAEDLVEKPRIPELTPYELQLLDETVVVAGNTSNLRQAIKRMDDKGFCEEAELLRQRYADILAEKEPELTPYELKLLNEEVFVPDSKGNLVRAIRCMENNGFHEEAKTVRKKYGWFLGGKDFLPEYTPEEVEERFEALFARFRK